MKKIIFLLVGIAFILPKGIEAGIHKKAGVSGVQFLKIGVGAKASGMGGAFIATCDDISSIYWNPAGLIRNKDKEFIFSHNEWLEDTHFEFVGLAQPRGNGKFGCSLTYLGYGELIGRDENDRLTGNFTAYDMALSIAYAKELKNALLGGANIKIIHQRNENEEAQGVAMDLGIQYNPSQLPNITIGAVIANIGPKMKFINEKYSLPLILKTGFSWNFLPNLFSSNLKLSADLIKPIDNNYEFNIGTEYKLKDIFLRAGYKPNTDIGKGITAGLGFKLNSYQIDYAYTPFDNLGNPHILSLMARF